MRKGSAGKARSCHFTTMAPRVNILCIKSWKKFFHVLKKGQTKKKKRKKKVSIAGEKGSIFRLYKFCSHFHHPIPFHSLSPSASPNFAGCYFPYFPFLCRPVYSNRETQEWFFFPATLNPIYHRRSLLIIPFGTGNFTAKTSSFSRLTGTCWS